jgi:hypothetical protein
MARKTIEIAKTLQMSNAYLAAPDSTPDGREAIASMITAILQDTGNYAGFRYLEQEMHANGTVKTLGCGSRREYFRK